MASNTFKLTVAKVDETLFDGEVISVTVPGAAGEMTLLPHHEAIASTLKKGTIKIKTAEGSKNIEVEDGVLECSGNKAVVLL